MDFEAKARIDNINFFRCQYSDEPERKNVLKKARTPLPDKDILEDIGGIASQIAVDNLPISQRLSLFRSNITTNEQARKTSEWDNLRPLYLKHGEIEGYYRYILYFVGEEEKPDNFIYLGMNKANLELGYRDVTHSMLDSMFRRKFYNKRSSLLREGMLNFEDERVLEERMSGTTDASGHLMNGTNWLSLYSVLRTHFPLYEPSLNESSRYYLSE